MGGGVDPILSVRLGVGLLLTSQCPRAPALTSRPRRARGQGSTPRAVGRRRRRPSPCGCGRISRTTPRRRGSCRLESSSFVPIVPGSRTWRGAAWRPRPRADGRVPPFLRPAIPWARERRRPGGEAKIPRPARDAPRNSLFLSGR